MPRFILYSKQQNDYKLAKQRFDKINKEFEKKLATLKMLGTPTQQQIEELLEETGLHNALNDLSTAENALLEWSHQMIQDQPDYLNNKEIIDNMYANIHRDPLTRAKLIQAAMKITK
jgi:alcohol dehydrogenase class IV